VEDFICGNEGIQFFLYNDHTIVSTMPIGAHCARIILRDASGRRVWDVDRALPPASEAPAAELVPRRPTLNQAMLPPTRRRNIDSPARFTPPASPLHQGSPVPTMMARPAIVVRSSEGREAAEAIVLGNRGKNASPLPATTTSPSPPPISAVATTVTPAAGVHPLPAAAAPPRDAVFTGMEGTPGCLDALLDILAADSALILSDDVILPDACNVPQALPPPGFHEGIHAAACAAALPDTVDATVMITADADANAPAEGAYNSVAARAAEQDGAYRVTATVEQGAIAVAAIVRDQEEALAAARECRDEAAAAAATVASPSSSTCSRADSHGTVSR